MPHDFRQTVNKGHGRIEIRGFLTISDPDFITYLDPKGKRLDLACIRMVKAERRIGDETSQETRYYILGSSGEAWLLPLAFIGLRVIIHNIHHPLLRRFASIFAYHLFQS